MYNSSRRTAGHITANSTKNPGHSGPSKITNRGMSTESEDQREHFQTTPRENSRNKRKRKRSGIAGPERADADGRRSGDGWAEEKKAQDKNGTPISPSPSALLQRIPLRTLEEAEAKLVFGGEHDITHKSSQAPARTGSQLMCQPAEILGPRSGPHLSSLPQIDKWLDVALQDADSCYRQKRYDTAASRFTTALELCSKGAIWEKPFNADYEDISMLVSFIESRLVACYLQMKRPDKALRHSHRSIHLNPAHFRNHLQQAMAYRLLGNPCEAARSAMIADYLLWLSGDTEEHISKLIKQYWQGLLEDAITEEEDFSVMFTPYSGVPSECCIQQAEEVFRKLHPGFTAYLFTGPSGGHFLPQTTDWNEPTPQAYFLTLGFRRSQDGGFLEKMLRRRSPEFTGLRAPFSPPRAEDIRRTCESLGRKILPVGFSTGSGLIERLQYAGHLGQLRRVGEQTNVLQQTLAELSVAPYLQEINDADFRLLQTLMADTVDTLEGRRTDGERVWNEMLKVGALENEVYELEEAYLRGKALRASRRQKARQRRQARKEQQVALKASSSSSTPPPPPPAQPASPGPQDPPSAEPEARDAVPSPGGPDSTSASQPSQE
ncbi:spermatogenesis-associated protein 16-like isoform X2 [Alosa sapidissima]|uniref:spermatogenesis-associated protein 16-like isoform X2 n=1 Tax=Alosa sapidissima TaxID=34773 RepID=UPI001C085C2A|nr:spermatogenesis-associated protein 16-like isoform X2 [Alosa sapidissima]